MISSFHDISLIHDDSLFFVFHDDFLINNFHGVKFTIILESTEKNFWKATWSYESDYLKRVKTYFVFIIYAVVVNPTTRLQI